MLKHKTDKRRLRCYKKVFVLDEESVDTQPCEV
jgi:hypothetical protein